MSENEKYHPLPGPVGYLVAASCGILLGLILGTILGKAFPALPNHPTPITMTVDGHKITAPAGSGISIEREEPVLATSETRHAEGATAHMSSTSLGGSAESAGSFNVGPLSLPNPFDGGRFGGGESSAGWETAIIGGGMGLAGIGILVAIAGFVLVYMGLGRLGWGLVVGGVAGVVLAVLAQALADAAPWLLLVGGLVLAGLGVAVVVGLRRGRDGLEGLGIAVRGLEAASGPLEARLEALVSTHAPAAGIQPAQLQALLAKLEAGELVGAVKATIGEVADRAGAGSRYKGLVGKIKGAQ